MNSSTQCMNITQKMVIKAYRKLEIAKKKCPNRIKELEEIFAKSDLGPTELVEYQDFMVNKCNEAIGKFQRIIDGQD